MTYTNEMVLPRNFAQHSEDEMMYLDGGWAIDSRWWGGYLYLNNKESKWAVNGTIAAALAAALSGIGASAAAILGAAGGLIGNYNEGYGVRIRYAKVTIYSARGKRTYYSFAGISSLTNNVINRKNRFI